MDHRSGRSMVRCGRLAAAALVAGLLSGCGAGAATPSAAVTAPPAGLRPLPTLDPASIVWLCRPGLADNPCTADLTATVAEADGSTHLESPSPAAASQSRSADPPIDCFYIYPTVSNQATPNSNLTIDPEERRAAKAQAARFSPVCRVYAPMYPSLTHTAVNNLSAVTPEQAQAAYRGVADAFHVYMANYNNGRGIVFIGHSQGAWHLEALLANEIDGDASMRRQLVSALLFGGNVAVPKGAVVGGDFANFPACTSASQVGCIVAYSTFNAAPPRDAWFGTMESRVNPFVSRNPSGDLQILCTNPANLAGGTGVLQPYFLTEELDFDGPSKTKNVTTLWASFPNQYSAHCESADGATWLQVDVIAPSTDARPAVKQSNGPQYGLHNVDLGIALGNLVDLVRAQAASFNQPSQGRLP
jgi:hypothetical protein